MRPGAAALSAVCAAVDSEAPARFAAQIADRGEPYELGVALALGEGGALISYNPRQRGGGARARMLAALDGAGLPTDAARAAFALVPDERCSTVLGLEWRPGVSVSATLYLEEITRFFPNREAARVMRGLARLAGAELSGEVGRPGPLYIWALDLGAQGAGAFKVYRYAEGAQMPGVRASLAAHVGGAPSGFADALLFGGAPASGYIAQRRYRGGAPSPLKIYKCYPYQQPGADLEGGRQEIRRAVEGLVRDPGSRRLAEALDGLPPTSLGLRFVPGSGEPSGGTAYWCAVLNRG